MTSHGTYWSNQIWYVGIEAAESPSWWEQVMSPGGLHHLSMLGLVCGKFVTVEWRLEGLYVTPLDQEQFDCGLARMMNECLVVLKTRPVKRFPRVRIRFGMSCVTLAAQILRLPGMVVTPKCVFRGVLRHGGEVLVDRSKADGNFQD